MGFPYGHIDQKGTQAVQQLRRQKLKQGQPFMINDARLPSNQCYLEYPDGKILLVALKDHRAMDFNILRELPVNECLLVLAANHLDIVF